jgi:hypothetical protein
MQAKRPLRGEPLAPRLRRTIAPGSGPAIGTDAKSSGGPTFIHGFAANSNAVLRASTAPAKPVRTLPRRSFVP